MIPILVIRHAPTDWNADGRLQGHADVALSEAGRAEARAARLPAGWERARCLASPLKRAFETAELFALRPEPEPRLIEMDWGDWQGRRLTELRAQLGPQMAENEARGLDFRPPGGESPRDVQARLRPLLAELGALGEPTILVTHKGVLRALYALATGWTMQDKAPHRLAGGCAHLFQVASGGAPAVAELNIPLGPSI